MNGKLKKIGLGLSGLMCAGMLFSCVSISEAKTFESEAGCGHTSKTYVGTHEGYDYYDDHIHDVYTIDDYVCDY